MKRNLVIGTLVMASVMQTTSTSYALGKKDKEVIGGIIGGIIGGAIGNQIGKGNGNTAATVIGAIAGAMIGSKVGREMENGDRRALEDAQRRGLGNRVGDRQDWDGRNYGSRSGARGSFTTTREGYNNRTGEYCREYHSVIYLRNKTEENRGVTCTRRDGSWYEVRQTEVSFNGRPGSGGGGGGHPRPQPGWPGQGGHNPGPAPIPVPMPPPPMNSPYQDSIRINQVTRRAGGEWFRVTLRRALSVSDIRVRVVSAGVKLHEAVYYSESGRQMGIRELSSTGAFYAGSTMVARLNSRDRIQVIDIRAESMGGFADLMLTVVSDEQNPALSVTRF